ncbi:DUF4321 domain-containing protein [Clostridium botulinum]|uniref:Membrane protein n=2 Tax=Clostridium botulinum TaxID=1491 RepID=A0A9Q1UYZ7_CLOBO|nr:DUF4321 domain-containing protein [Clostridium botulinum]AEB75551.1 Predicted membrane protein [Clostridium botulinum BKT015925]KEH99580.1 membrane protein [Clostridium botulinum D str. 16868]KEI03512.1 membrane protein [Clostridium botulinum C/D str. Sp77]KEI04243.1 membrane protein [Clostridium botulinum C/D str. BKT75002]KEI12237.1 membrane protein [Clostridium botulinum C/D str. BKT2873]
MRGNNKSGFFVFIILLGGICGSFIGEILGNNIGPLSFLKATYPIGTASPFVLNLKVVEITFGVNFYVNVMAIIGVIIAILLYRKY